MNIEKGTKAMVFQAKKDENRKRTVIADISTYEGRDQDDKDRIIIQSGIVDNVYNKEKEKLYVTVTIFRFENDEENGK